MTIWKWQNSGDIESMARLSEVLCEGTENLLDRKTGVCDSVAVGT